MKEQYEKSRAFILALKAARNLIKSGLAGNMHGVRYTRYGNVLSGLSANPGTLSGYLRQAVDCGLVEAREAARKDKKRMQPREWRLTDAFYFCNENLGLLERFWALTNATNFKVARALISGEKMPSEIAREIGVTPAAVSMSKRPLKGIIVSDGRRYRLKDWTALAEFEHFAEMFFDKEFASMEAAA